MAKQVREEIAVEITRMKDAIGIVPGLAAILVGSSKDSQTYVRNKKKECEAVGIKSYEVDLPEDSSEEEVITHIATFRPLRRPRNEPPLRSFELFHCEHDCVT
jgi:5,10-methylene-tetrahydrofolate dehydrogenase/methenyl tetrahydrofolate cyclohydrolase